MSADAKVWLVGPDDTGGVWAGTHDGACPVAGAHTGESLSAILSAIEQCLGGPLRWCPQVYPDRRVGLRGYRS